VCPHKQGKSLVVKLTMIRVVCMNTLMLALKGNGSEFRMVHRHDFNADMRQRAKHHLGIAREQIDEFAEVASKLKKMSMSTDDAWEVFCIAAGEEKLERDKPHKVIDKITECYENAPGADVGNAWGVLNGVTYYVDHVASRTADKRLTNAWLGKGAVMKERAFAALTR
jgi:hypothetical protein